MVKGDPNGAGLIGSGHGNHELGGKRNDVSKCVVIDGVYGCGAFCIWEGGKTTKRPELTNGKGGDGFDDEGVFDDLGGIRGGVAITTVFSGEPFLP